MKKVFKFLLFGAGMLYASTIAKVLAPEESDHDQARQDGFDSREDGSGLSNV